MVRLDANTRLRGGFFNYRRFAYLNKSDHKNFGLLEATSHKDARRWLGKRYYIRQVWLSESEYALAGDRDRKWEIVSSVFLSPNSVAYIRAKNAND